MIKPAKQLKTQDKIKLSDDNGFEIFTVRAVLNSEEARVLRVKIRDSGDVLYEKYFGFDEEVEVL